MLSNLYTITKPLLILLISICIVSKLDSLVNFIQSALDFSSYDTAFNLLLSISVIIFGFLFFLLEALYNYFKTKIVVLILDENELAGNTPILLNDDLAYKRVYISIEIIKAGRFLQSEENHIKIVFPKGISSNFADYSNFMKQEENELIVNLYERDLIKEGREIIPIDISLATSHLEKITNIDCNSNIKGSWIISSIDYTRREIKIKSEGKI